MKLIKKIIVETYLLNPFNSGGVLRVERCSSNVDLPATSYHPCPKCQGTIFSKFRSFAGQHDKIYKTNLVHLFYCIDDMDIQLVLTYSYGFSREITRIPDDDLCNHYAPRYLARLFRTGNVSNPFFSKWL